MKNECAADADCASNMACIRNACVDPCPGVCGIKADCFVRYHTPVCTCLDGYTGNPFTICHAAPRNEIPQDKCNQWPCDENEQVGCVRNSDCPRDFACLKSKCKNPCAGDACAPNAQCTVINHTPICTCPSGMEGNPFVQCRPVESVIHGSNGCRPNPCGSYVQCRELNGQALCSCSPGYLGSPPNCRPQCTMNSECASHLACINTRCEDPCRLDPCGENTECSTIENRPRCVCMPNYNGNPFDKCHPIDR